MPFLAASERFLFCPFDWGVYVASGSVVRGCFSIMKRFKKRAESRNQEPQEKLVKW